MTSKVKFTWKYSKLRNNMYDVLRCSFLDSCNYIILFFGILFHLKMPNPNLVMVYQDQEVIYTINIPRFPQQNFRKFCNYKEHDGLFSYIIQTKIFIMKNMMLSITTCLSN